MARRVRRAGDGAAVRTFLLERSRELLQHALDGPGYEHGKPIEPPPPPVDVVAAVAVPGSFARTLAHVFGYTALRDGGEYQLRRSELPDWHPLAKAGHPGDTFTLTAANELVPL